MTKAEYREEIGFYISDIYKYFDQDDMKSCLIMARGLVKLLVEYKRGTRNE